MSKADSHEHTTASLREEKFLFICAFSGVMALTRLPLAQVLAYPETSELLKAVMTEGV